MSSEILNEDDLQAQVMRNTMLEVGTPFPKIRRIAGEIISPEIDLLYVFQTKDKQVLTGYEFKLLNSKQNKTNYRRIYEGIGQAILYFQYGIDTSCLLLGISKNAPLEQEIAIDKKTHQLSKIMKYQLRCLGIKVWRERNPHLVDTIVKPEGTFSYSYFKDYRLCRENLLSGKFVYSKSFLERVK